MTEQQKRIALQLIADRAAIAARLDLPEIARSWRDYYSTVLARPAADIVLSATSPIALEIATHS